MCSSDLELLTRYARQGEEDAFTEVVRRHAGMVYATALRATRSPQLAEDIAQSVFLELARNVTTLRPDTVLTAWLYFSTRRIAANTLRGESRRLNREQTAYAMNAAEESSPPPAELEPLLDDALEALTETDRIAILMRFFEDKSLADVGKALGVSADAAQKRVSRAVEQMRGFFCHRGIATGTVAITALLAANTSKAAPVGLVASIYTTVHSAGIPLTTTAITTSTLIKAATMTTLQKSLIGLILAAAVGVAVRQTYEVSQLREQIQTAQSLIQKTSTSQEEKTGVRGGRTGTAKAGRALTPAQIEEQIHSLSEIGIAKFGRVNMNRLIAQVSVDDIPRLLPLVDQQIPNDLRHYFHVAWFERWAAVDAPAAFAYASGIDNKDPVHNKNTADIVRFHRNLRTPAMASTLASWADRDLAGAIRAVDAYTGPDRQDASSALANAWVETDPHAAGEWALQIPDSKCRLNVLGSIFAKWAEKDPAAARQWLQGKGLTETELRQIQKHAAQETNYQE